MAKRRTTSRRVVMERKERKGRRVPVPKLPIKSKLKRVVAGAAIGAVATSTVALVSNEIMRAKAQKRAVSIERLINEIAEDPNSYKIKREKLFDFFGFALEAEMGIPKKTTQRKVEKLAAEMKRHQRRVARAKKQRPLVGGLAAGTGVLGGGAIGALTKRRRKGKR